MPLQLRLAIEVRSKRYIEHERYFDELKQKNISCGTKILKLINGDNFFESLEGQFFFNEA